MSKYDRKTVILVKSEVTPGTDPVPTGAANAILAKNFTFTPLEMAYVERNNIRGFFGNFASLPTTRIVKCSFEVEAAGSGTAATPTGYGPLLTACAALETIGASVVYTPQSPGIKTVTIYVSIDGTSSDIVLHTPSMVNIGATGGTFLVIASPSFLTWIAAVSAATGVPAPSAYQATKAKAV